jgi:hypothetical protein
MIDTFEKLKNISLQFGLIVNENKTKYMKCTRKETHSDRLMIGNIQIDKIRSFCYLGTIANGNNTLEEEIRERIVKGNKAFYANRILFKSNLVSRKSKLKLYWSVIRPTVVYGCKTWVLKESIIQRLSVFERKILKKIYIVHSPTNALFIKRGKVYNLHKYRSYMFRSSTTIRELVLSLVKVILKHSVKLCPYRLCGSVAA